MNSEYSIFHVYRMILQLLKLNDIQKMQSHQVSFLQLFLTTVSQL